MKSLLALVIITALAVVTTMAQVKDDAALAAFINCQSPFNATKRLHLLISASVIEAKPATHMDGIPHFHVKGKRYVFGFRVIAVAGFDADHWDKNLYYRAPGTLPPRYVSLFVMATEENVKVAVKKADKSILDVGHEEDFADWFPLKPTLRKEVSEITEITCFFDWVLKGKP